MGVTATVYVQKIFKNLSVTSQISFSLFMFASGLVKQKKDTSDSELVSGWNYETPDRH